MIKVVVSLWNMAIGDGDDGDNARLRQNLEIILILNTNILKTVIRTKMMIRMTNCHSQLS